MSATTTTAKTPTKKRSPRTPSDHPTYSDMITAAINSLKDRKGSSRQAIAKYVKLNYKVGDDSIKHIKLALKRMVSKNLLVQTKGTGSSGSFKLPSKAGQKKADTKKTPVKKATATKKKTAKKPAAAKKTPAKKPTGKKTPAQKSPTKKPVVKKSAVKKPATKKPAAKKQATKKPAAKKTTAAKKTAAKKTAGKKTAK